MGASGPADNDTALSSSDDSELCDDCNRSASACAAHASAPAPTSSAHFPKMEGVSCDVQKNTALVSD